VEIEASRRDSRHGEKLFVERKSPWRESLRGETSPRREVLRGERLQGETLSMERTSMERTSMERTSKETGASWRDSLLGEVSPRRDDLQGDNDSVERFFEERLSPGRTLVTHLFIYLLFIYSFIDCPSRPLAAMQRVRLLL